MRIVIVMALLLGVSATAFGHSGRTDKDGCHANKKTGKYHCHDDALGYQRENWRHWIDMNNDCQNTRDEILIRDSKAHVLFKTEKNCKVLIGKWIGPYTKTKFYFARELHIDHVVPLKHAYDSGGAAWSSEKKKIFANDFENLLAVDKIANIKKGAKGPAHWLPASPTYWCEYGKKWRGIKNKYKLIIDAAEELALKNMEQHCD